MKTIRISKLLLALCLCLSLALIGTSSVYAGNGNGNGQGNGNNNNGNNGNNGNNQGNNGNNQGNNGNGNGNGNGNSGGNGNHGNNSSNSQGALKKAAATAKRIDQLRERTQTIDIEKALQNDLKKSRSYGMVSPVSRQRQNKVVLQELNMLLTDLEKSRAQLTRNG